MRLFRLNIEVDDIELARAFYAALLALEGRPSTGGRFYLRAGDVTLQVVQVAKPQLAAKALSFAVPDLDAVYARARDLGCLSDDAIHGENGGAPLLRPWGERSFYARDPAGNPLCFVDEGTVYTG